MVTYILVFNQRFVSIGEYYVANIMHSCYCEGLFNISCFFFRLEIEILFHKYHFQN